MNVLELTPEQAAAKKADLAQAGLTLVKRADGKRAVRHNNRVKGASERKRQYPVSKLNKHGTQTPKESNVYTVQLGARPFARASKRSVEVGLVRGLAGSLTK